MCPQSAQFPQRSDRSRSVSLRVFICFIFSLVLDKGLLPKYWVIIAVFHSSFTVLILYCQLFFFPFFLSLPALVKLQHIHSSNSTSTSFAEVTITFFQQIPKYYNIHNREYLSILIFLLLVVYITLPCTSQKSINKLP